MNPYPAIHRKGKGDTGFRRKDESKNPVLMQSSLDYSAVLGRAPDPESATVRFERLLQGDEVRAYVEKMSADTLAVFIHLISISQFLFRFLARHPEAVALLGTPLALERQDTAGLADLGALRRYKYRELLKITWLDLCGKDDYRRVLFHLSRLADNVANRCLQLLDRDRGPAQDGYPYCVFAMGKLGAGELNFSSDIDLIFASADPEEEGQDAHVLLEYVTDQVRRFSKAMEDVTADGFLYRVDLKLRPWGRSGPLVLTVDETEHYYEASTEAWERFAWLRARVLAGNQALGADLLERLQPFIYRRALGSDDLQRFIEIKRQMGQQRQREGSWNVKLGEGGIRDIEFFIQILQCVNAATHPRLKTTNTLDALQGLADGGFVAADEARAIQETYLFLRRLENRLQMQDEQQTHQLPDHREARMKIASSLGYGNITEARTLEEFDRALDQHRLLARSCFERVLPST